MITRSSFLHNINSPHLNIFVSELGLRVNIAVLQSFFADNSIYRLRSGHSLSNECPNQHVESEYQKTILTSGQA